MAQMQKNAENSMINSIGESEDIPWFCSNCNAELTLDERENLLDWNIKSDSDLYVCYDCWSGS